MPRGTGEVKPPDLACPLHVPWSSTGPCFQAPRGTVPQGPGPRAPGRFSCVVVLYKNHPSRSGTGRGPRSSSPSSTRRQTEVQYRHVRHSTPGRPRACHAAPACLPTRGGKGARRLHPQSDPSPTRPPYERPSLGVLYQAGRDVGLREWPRSGPVSMWHFRGRSKRSRLLRHRSRNPPRNTDPPPPSDPGGVRELHGHRVRPSPVSRVESGPHRPLVSGPTSTGPLHSHVPPPPPLPIARPLPPSRTPFQPVPSTFTSTSTPTPHPPTPTVTAPPVSGEVRVVDNGNHDHHHVEARDTVGDQGSDTLPPPLPVNRRSQPALGVPTSPGVWL